jgi:hypothetical protein
LILFQSRRVRALSSKLKISFQINWQSPAAAEDCFRLGANAWAGDLVVLEL